MTDLNAKIIPLHSEVEGRVPTDAQLDVGELSYNITDRKIYTKDTAGNIVVMGAGADEEDDGLPGGSFEPNYAEGTQPIGRWIYRGTQNNAVMCGRDGEAAYSAQETYTIVCEIDEDGNDVSVELQAIDDHIAGGGTFWVDIDGTKTEITATQDNYDDNNCRFYFRTDQIGSQADGVEIKIYPAGGVPNESAIPLADGDILRYDGTNWRPLQHTLENLDNVDGTAASGNVLQYDGTTWQTQALDFSIEDSSDFALRVDDGSGNELPKTTGDALVWDGTNWVPANVASFLTISDLSDVNTVTNAPTNGQVLTWDEAQGYWKPGDAGSGGGGSDLQGTTESGNTTDQGIFITKANGDAAIDLENTGAATVRGLLQVKPSTRGEKIRLHSGAAGSVNLGVSGSSAEDIFEYNIEDGNGSHKFSVGSNEVMLLKALNIEAKQKVISPATIADDPGTTLTTKKFVEDLIELATGGGLSGAGALTERADVTVSNAYIAGQSRDEVFIGLGEAGTFVQVTVSNPAWVRFYATAADRTSDSGRQLDVDPLPGSGVLMELKTTQPNQLVKITPAAIYYNNDTLPDQALYARIRNEAGEDTTIAVTVRAYTQTDTDTIDGGSFGSG